MKNIIPGPQAFKKILIDFIFLGSFRFTENFKHFIITTKRKEEKKKENPDINRCIFLK